MNDEVHPSHKKTSTDVLLQEAKNASTSPGVYLMRDERGAVLYVGKAKNLKNRLVTYFQPAGPDSPRIQMLVASIQRFEVILTETETEALLLECTLIKKHKPRYNIRLRDDKTYPFIKIQVNDGFPRLEWTRRVLKDGARYFGPFPSGWEAKQVLILLNETFQLRDCSDNTFHHRSRPCLLYQVQKCSGPCVGHVSAEDYRATIQEVVSVLEGKGDRLLGALRNSMQKASDEEDFESAALYRDQIQNLELVGQTQGVVQAGVDSNRDVVGLARQGNLAHATLLIVRRGKLVAVRHYELKNTEPELTDARVLSDFLSQAYLQKTDEPEGLALAEELLVPNLPEDLELLASVVSSNIRLEESKEDHQLLNVAQANARHALENSEKRKEGHGAQALEDVRKRLHLQRTPHRIECYDISNFQGTDSVASRVVFIDGAPDKNLYRRYKIKTVDGSNDFAMMKEVLGRRFNRSDDSFPDLVVVDGGKGQLAQAVAILSELNIQGVEICGLAKARTEQAFQKSEVESTSERIFIPDRKNPIPLAAHMLAYQLLVHVRDEAHRFAINYHRNLRSKRHFGER